MKQIAQQAVFLILASVFLYSLIIAVQKLKAKTKIVISHHEESGEFSMATVAICPAFIIDQYSTFQEAMDQKGIPKVSALLQDRQ